MTFILIEVRAVVLGGLTGSNIGRSVSDLTHRAPWKIPQMFHQQFMKDFFSLWGFGEVWGIF